KTLVAKAEKRRFAAQGFRVKRQKLLKEIIKRGAVFVRHGANRDIYENPQKKRFYSNPPPCRY
ncbi:MAG: hypothetical protein LBQ88_14945, partial [Treponema sp.]|nr:hypothetical protein [Treponema sp.]